MIRGATRSFLLGLVLSGVACGGEPEGNTTRDEATGGARSNAVLVPTPEPESDLVPTAATLPIPEDFEGEMAESVTPQNYRMQLESVMEELDAT